jgi:glycosyltransferase involved in cell wall biosynthesis
LRWLEYSALKLPTVASKVYPFKNSIRDGEDGLICNSSQQWYDALKSLITDQSRRQTLGKQAYARVRKDFNMDETAKAYAAILEEIRCNDPT